MRGCSATGTNTSTPARRRCRPLLGGDEAAVGGPLQALPVVGTGAQEIAEAGGDFVVDANGAGDDAIDEIARQAELGGEVGDLDAHGGEELGAQDVAGGAVLGGNHHVHAVLWVGGRRASGLCNESVTKRCFREKLVA